MVGRIPASTISRPTALAQARASARSSSSWPSMRLRQSPVNSSGSRFSSRLNAPDLGREVAGRRAPPAPRALRRRPPRRVDEEHLLLRADAVHTGLEGLVGQHPFEGAEVLQHPADGDPPLLQPACRLEAHRQPTSRQVDAGSMARQVCQSCGHSVPHWSTRFGTPLSPSTWATAHDSPTFSLAPCPRPAARSGSAARPGHGRRAREEVQRRGPRRSRRRPGRRRSGAGRRCRSCRWRRGTRRGSGTCRPGR